MLRMGAEELNAEQPETRFEDENKEEAPGLEEEEKKKEGDEEQKEEEPSK